MPKWPYLKSSVDDKRLKRIWTTMPCPKINELSYAVMAVKAKAQDNTTVLHFYNINFYYY